MDLTRINTERLWTQDRDGKISSTDSDPIHFPIAVSRFPLTLTTRYYERRPDDGGYGSDDMFQMAEVTVPSDLVVALVTKRNIPLHQAIIYAGVMCERCHNAMAYELNLGWGYAEGSDPWKEAGTSCSACEYMSIPPIPTADTYAKTANGVPRNIDNPEPVDSVTYAVGRSIQ